MLMVFLIRHKFVRERKKHTAIKHPLLRDLGCAAFHYLYFMSFLVRRLVSSEITILGNMGKAGFGK
jgi:hypothetical protein